MVQLLSSPLRISSSVVSWIMKRSVKIISERFIVAARSGFEDHDCGSIKVGKFSDLAVLSECHGKMRCAELFDLRAEATIFGGEIVFER